jgi:hypothetical protein
VHRGDESGKIVVPQQFISDSENAPMPTERNPDLFGFVAVEGREVVAAFDGGALSSDAGALLLGATRDRDDGPIWGSKPKTATFSSPLKVNGLQPRGISVGQS